MISQMIVVQKYISIEEHPVGITHRFPLPAFPKKWFISIHTRTC
jgi:hypothetical protein